VSKDYSLDENLWHLSVEGGVLEDPSAALDIEGVLAAVSDRFAAGVGCDDPDASVRIGFEHGIPTTLGGRATDLPAVIDQLNRDHRHAPWAWDLVIENRFTGIKSRGLYINPAGKLLHLAIDALARSCLNKPSYEHWCELGRQYASMLYRGEYFSDQRMVLDATAEALMEKLTGSVTMTLSPTPYASRIDAPSAMFREDMATFEASDFSHADAGGFIRLSWLSQIGRPFARSEHESDVETGSAAAPDLRSGQPVPGSGLVSTAV